MGLELLRVREEADAQIWHAIDELCVPVDHPGLVADPLVEVLGQLPEGSASERVYLYLAYDGDLPVANAALELPMADNTHIATLRFSVAPSLRRRGYGTRLFHALAEVAESEGRSVLGGEVGAPLGASAPGQIFASRLDAKLVLENVRRDLDLAEVDFPALEALGKRLGAAAGEYRLVSWIDRAPEDFLDDAAALLGRMLTDAPTGDLSWQAQRWDAKRYREKEDSALRRGRLRVATGAVQASSGRLVAYTDIGVSRRQPGLAYQWDTIVAPAHRGNRLGLWVKLANLLSLRAQGTETTTVVTWNAAENRYMIAINDALGFRPAERWSEWELRR